MIIITDQFLLLHKIDFRLRNNRKERQKYKVSDIV